MNGEWIGSEWGVNRECAVLKTVEKEGGSLVGRKWK